MRPFILGTLFGLGLAITAHEWMVHYSQHGVLEPWQGPKGFVKKDGVVSWFPPLLEDTSSALEDAA